MEWFTYKLLAGDRRRKREIFISVTVKNEMELYSYVGLFVSNVESDSAIYRIGGKQFKIEKIVWSNITTREVMTIVLKKEYKEKVGYFMLLI